MKDIIIKEIDKDSIAEELGIEAGDKLISINGIMPTDILEYRYLINDEHLMMEIEKNSGEIWEIDIEKDYDEPIGLVFIQEILDEPKGCHNNCIFCFIDQLPKGMRDTLYFKDDDTRLSFLHGNYVTLTNLTESEIDKIIQYRIQPINISVHTTDSELRVKMLRNKKASNIDLIIRQFYNNAIYMNVQIVLVPGFNDGEALKSTLIDLIQLYPYLNSISVVPVGISKYRDGLYPLRTFTSLECTNTISLIEEIQAIMFKKFNNYFVYPSDEFFIKGGKKLPNIDYYHEFSQLENGVGMMSLFYSQCLDSLNHQYIGIKDKDIHIVTGVLAGDYLQEISNNIMIKYPQINIHLHIIKNNFFGDEITVSGLITGVDILEYLKDKEIKGEVLIPENMLRYDTECFLDDMTVEYLSKELKCNIIPIEVTGKKIIEKILY